MLGLMWCRCGGLAGATASVNLHRGWPVRIMHQPRHRIPAWYHLSGRRKREVRSGRVKAQSTSSAAMVRVLSPWRLAVILDSYAYAGVCMGWPLWERSPLIITWDGGV